MSTNENVPISGKDIVIPDPAPPATLRQILQGLLDEMGNGPGKNDQVRSLIEVCIAEGVTNGSEILDAISALGFDRKHAGILLGRSLSRTPSQRLLVQKCGRPVRASCRVLTLRAPG